MGVGLMLAAALLLLGDDFEGEITSGKAKQLFDEGLGLVKEAEAIYELWYLSKLPEAEVEPQAKRAADLFKRGADRLAQALDIKYNRGVDAVLLRATAKSTKLEFFLLGREMERQPKPPRPEREPVSPAPPAPEPEEAPAPPAPPEVPAPAAPEFRPEAPPGLPVDASLPEPPFRYDAKQRARETEAIAKFLREWCESRRDRNLLFKHVPCGGSGKVAGGAACGECGGTGQVINLHHFRRAYWNCYSPQLRNAEGALDAIQAFRLRAQRDLPALGPLVKTFQVAQVEWHGVWARALLKEQTGAGAAERWITVVNAAGRWCLYSPRTDAELVPR
jgi:hypothetical protein